MKPEMRDESYPLFGKVSVPRMILAQFDSINTHLLHKYGKKVLSELEGFMSRGSTTMWYTVYLCLFILLREASWLSEDRYRHARNNFGSSVSGICAMLVQCYFLLTLPYFSFVIRSPSL